MNQSITAIVDAAGTYASRIADYVSERMHDYARRGIAATTVLGMLAAPQIGRAKPRELHGEVNGERCLEAEIITIYATYDAEHCAAGEKNFLQAVEDALSKRGYLVSETRQNVIINPRTGLPFLRKTYGMGACFPEGGGCDMPPALPSAKLALVHNLQEGEAFEWTAWDTQDAKKELWHRLRDVNGRYTDWTYEELYDVSGIANSMWADEMRMNRVVTMRLGDYQTEFFYKELENRGLAGPLKGERMLPSQVKNAFGDELCPKVTELNIKGIKGDSPGMQTLMLYCR